MKIEINQNNWYEWLFVVIEIIWIRFLLTKWDYVLLELQLADEQNPLSVFSLSMFVIIWGALNLLFIAAFVLMGIEKLFNNGFSITLYDSNRNNPEEQDKANKNESN